MFLAPSVLVQVLGLMLVLVLLLLLLLVPVDALSLPLLRVAALPSRGALPWPTLRFRALLRMLRPSKMVVLHRTYRGMQAALPSPVTRQSADCGQRRGRRRKQQHRQRAHAHPPALPLHASACLPLRCQRVCSDVQLGGSLPRLWRVAQAVSRKPSRPHHSPMALPSS